MPAPIIAAPENPAPPTPPPPAPVRPRPGLFFNPYFQLGISLILSAAAQICLKKGADSAVTEIWLGFNGVRSGWTWLAYMGMVGSLFFWLYSLRFVPLNIAYNFTGLIQVIVPLGSWLFLGERIGLRRACGILLVLIGVLVVARPLLRVEEKL